jgi:hypothetical protein
MNNENKPNLVTVTRPQQSLNMLEKIAEKNNHIVLEFRILSEEKKSINAASLLKHLYLLARNSFASTFLSKPATLREKAFFFL